MQSLCDTFWVFRPEVSLSLHLASKKSRKILLRKSLTRSCSRSPSPHIFGSWIVETWFPGQPLISARARDEGKNLENTGSDFLVSKQLLGDLDFEEDFGSEDITCATEKGTGLYGPFSRIYQPVEEPWLLESSDFDHFVRETDSSSGLTGEGNISDDLIVDATDSNSLSQSIHSLENKASSLNNKSLKRLITEREYPVEEPWLSIEVSRDDVSVENNVENLDPQGLQIAEILSLDKLGRRSVGNEKENQRPLDELEEVPKFFFDDEGTVGTREVSVDTVILINSSLCTMQRVAVMEDEELVEILLEPIKNNVQCDSVYIGVVTKLVPHMSGAFVNIGHSRASLVEIRHNVEPFIFPPFGHHKEHRSVDGSLLVELLENPRTNETKHKSEEVEVIDNIEDHDIIHDPDQNHHDDFGEQDMDEEFDVTEDFPGNANGGVVSSVLYINGERNIFQPIGSSHDSQRQTMTDITVSMKRSNNADHQLQEMESNKGSCASGSKWAQVQKGTKIIVQVVKEGLGSKGPTLTAYPKTLISFFKKGILNDVQILLTRCNRIGISKKISGVERTRLRVIAKTLQPPGFGLTVRTVAAGHTLDELQKDLDGLLSMWKGITEQATSAALAADEGVEGAIPVMLHRAMGQTLSVVQDYFNDKVKKMVVDSPRIYHEVTNYLQEIAPDLCDRVELYNKKNPIFDEYNIEEELNNMLSKRVPLSNGGYLVIEQTEALVSIDVNGGQCMLGHGTSQDKAILEVNLVAAKQIARELRLRDIGGIIVVDFIDMSDDSNKRLVYEEVKNAVERDRSLVKVSELSRHGLMEITRKRVRPSVTFMISEPCSCCHATGRVEALETSFSKIEREICRLLVRMERPDPGKPETWQKFVLMVDRGAFELKPLADFKDHKDEAQISRPARHPLKPPHATGAMPRRKVTIFPIKKWKTGGK
ncbi:Nucleic acid-binding, OB-fold [Cynara cardunculus var. scolymus]|uniref:Nucleic acid-binding, OB-fold n=1 Tax=Cynara cardunculus var. scolymus TaxID=59895 RepID=A0A118JUX3_CYNCS|nr:Nucleic acid-binding, OB-fold [Cynara cardunculus var. scolymus]